MPTLGQVEASWVAAVTLLDIIRKAGNINGSNWVSQQRTFEGIFNNSDFSAVMESGVASARSILSAVLSNQTAATLTQGHLQSYLRHVINGDNIGDPQTMIDRIYRYMVDNSKTVQSRNFTFATPAAGGGNIGNGLITRLNVDEYGFSIENQHVDAKTARCVTDQNSGTGIGEEVFELYGQAPGPDGLQVSGSGARRFMTCLSARNSLLSNPSFDQFSGTFSAPTDITSWTSSLTVNGTNYDFDGTNYYRSFQGTTPYALNMKATGTLTQKLSAYNTKLRTDVPYLLQLAWNRQVHAATGTLQISLGSKTNSVVLAAQTGWNLLTVPSAIGTNCWLKNFNQNHLQIQISWTNTGGTGVLLDDFLLVPGTRFDGGWYWFIGGSTAFLKNDIFTFTDTATDPGLINYWLWRSHGRYLPSTTGAPTWSSS